ncbi:MAG: hypothetical protein ABI041_09950, partial [Bdellovibrionia bacterium]
FHGEDMKLGFGLADKGKRMAMCSATTLDTDAPTSVLGKGANYFRQRVRCWEMTRHTMFGKALLNLISPFSKGAKNSVMGTLVKKKAQFTLVVGTTSDWLRIPLTVIMATNPNYWIKLGAFNAVAAVSPLLLNYAGPLDKRPDLKANLGGVISYPVYKLLYSAVSVAGALRAVLIYTPNFKRQPTIKELEEMKDPRCVWLNEGECQQITQAQ